ncbi:MAG: hemolysin III family protein [Tissierellia bacterium]|nr:hemolysin III family protein [Tissierellia bacterium]
MEIDTHSIKKMVKLTFNEEVANVITHSIMTLIFLFLLPFSAVYSYIQGGVLLSFGTSVFVICIFFMFLISTLYHSMAYDTPHKVVFRILDHIAIYFAIAGSYTPIALSLIGGWKAIVILIVQWSCVIFGIFYKAVAKKEYPKFTLTLYLIMGWTAILFMPTLIKNSKPLFLVLIVLGGVLYSVGAYFYTRKKKWAHMIWHIFINAASISHFIAIVFYLI